jgi:hypothetical protein
VTIFCDFFVTQKREYFQSLKAKAHKAGVGANQNRKTLARNQFNFLDFQAGLE